MTIIPYFKVTEKYCIGGQTNVMRRDLRSGQAKATAKMLQCQRGVILDVNFGQPFPGRSFVQQVWMATYRGFLVQVQMTIQRLNQSSRGIDPFLSLSVQVG